jgi:molecular chaperone DnaK
VAVGRPSGRVTGTGFLVSDRLVVTNRHWLLDDRVPVEPARVTVGGAPIERIFLPEGSLADLAVLRLAAPSTVAPFRLGYPKLARVGDPVWTPAQGGVHGVIDAFETFPEEGLRLFRTGLRLPAEASGGPLLNDLGEVVGIVSINERSTGAFALTADALDPLLAQAGFSR